MTEFTVLAFTPAGHCRPDLAIAACRAGGVGVVNGELLPDSAQARHALDALSAATAAPYGAKCDAIDAEMEAALRSHARRGLQWLVVDAALVTVHAALVRELRAAGVKVTHLDYPRLVHGFVGMAGVLPAARKALSEICQSLTEQL